MIVCRFEIPATRQKGFQEIQHHKNQFYDEPPPHVPLVIPKIRILHKDIYTIGHKLSKSSKLGIHSAVEKLCLEILALAIESAFLPRHRKEQTLELLRVKIELEKNLVRSEHELAIIDERAYLSISEQLVEISRDVSNWINFITHNTAKRG